MHFETLTIENYGRTKKAALNFPASPGLTVIFGPNEAGKSTALEAISDFFFGVPEKSARQIFGADNICLSASLALADGTRLSLRRRKGRVRTLTNDVGQPVDEAALGKILGATTRERFCSLFGLGHEALRKGGDDLLKADGEIGRLILAAGGGLGSFVKIVDELPAEAAKLFGNRKSADRLFYVGLTAFEEADKAVKQGVMTREHYVKAQQQLKAAKDTEDFLRRRRGERMKEHLRLERLARVIPSILAFDRITAEASVFADLPPLRENFAASCAKALDDRTRAEQALQEAEERCAAAERLIENLVVTPAILEMDVKIRDAGEKALHVSKARDDRPNREIELAGFADALKSLRLKLGLADDAALETAAPSPEAVEQAQKLAAEGLERRGKIAGLVQERARELKTLESVQKRQKERRDVGMDQPFGLKATQFAPIAQLSASRAAKEKQAEAAKQDFRAALARLRFDCVGDLEAFPCPDEALIQSEIDRRAAIELELLRAEEKIAAAREKRDQARDDVRRLSSGGAMPSIEALESVRAERDGLFEEIKSRYLSFAAQKAAERSQKDREADIAAHQTFKTSADALADRRTIEAERVAALELAQRQEAEAEGALAALGLWRADLPKKLASAEEAWDVLWPEAAAREKNLGRLKALAAELPPTLGRHSQWRAKADEIEALEADLSARVAALSLAEARLGLLSSGSLNERVATATAAIEIHDAAFADYRTDESGLSDIRARLADIEDSQAALLEEEAKWRAGWEPTARALKLPEAAALERANEIATQWAAADGVFKGLRQTRHRMNRMDEDEKRLCDAVKEIAANLDFELPSDSVAAAGLLVKRLDEARKVEIERRSAARHLRSMVDDREEKRELAAAAKGVVGALCKEADCAPETLAEFSARFAKKLEAGQKLRQLAGAIAERGDGQTLEALRAQWAGRDLDEIVADAALFKREADDLDAEINEAFATRRDRERDLDKLVSFEGVNAAVAERESAIAEMHRALERYVEISLAEELLRAAMEKLREERQDPLILRAGELFATATAGAFAGVDTDVDAAGVPVVVGRRSGGEEVPVKLMSDGVRDQLYLAFRIASIEHYAEAAEPLPFIADDLLVHFDDDRGAAALGLLAELGRTTQVLLFTHHRSLKAAAAPLVAQNRAAILELAP